MTSFPFGIRDICNLCGITVKAQNKSEYVTCPFCGKPKKLNINFERNQYRCPRCGESGSMLKLYATLKGFVGKSNGEIVAEIKKELNIGDNYTPFNNPIEPKKAEPLTIDFEKMNRTDLVYRAFLSQLGLGFIHRQKLKEDRHMSDIDINRFMFRSVPLFGYKHICKSLIDKGFQLEGIGGFYWDVDGWNIAINPKITGYIIPVWNYFNKIAGIQIRMDNPMNGYKYHLVSSSDYPQGTSTKTEPFYIAGTRKKDTLIVSEGFFKAAIPNKFFAYNCMALFGVNNQKEFERLIPFLKEDGIKNVVEAFDADFKTNNNVRTAKKKFKDLVVNNGFNYSTFEWDISQGKGLDDYVLNLPQVKKALE